MYNISNAYAFVTRKSTLPTGEKGELTMLHNDQLSVAINFLFPGLSVHSEAHQEIRKFIREQCKEKGACVMYYLNKDFVDLISSFSLSIGTKEVIVTDKTVRATKHYHVDPSIIFEV